MLIDTGASTNFVSANFIKGNPLAKVKTGRRYAVRLANGKVVHTNKFVLTTVILGNTRFRENFLLLDNLAFDIILGRSWLKCMIRISSFLRG